MTSDRPGLPREPVEHDVPLLSSEIEPQLLGLGHRDQLRPLVLVQQGRQLLVGAASTSARLSGAAARACGALREQLDHRRALLIGQLKLVRDGRVGQASVIKRRQYGRRDSRLLLAAASEGLAGSCFAAGAGAGFASAAGAEAGSCFGAGAGRVSPPVPAQTPASGPELPGSPDPVPRLNSISGIPADMRRARAGRLGETT